MDEVVLFVECDCCKGEGLVFEDRESCDPEVCPACGGSGKRKRSK